MRNITYNNLHFTLVTLISMISFSFDFVEGDGTERKLPIM